MEELKPCPFCNCDMTTDEDGNLVHPSYIDRKLCLCPLCDMTFDYSERERWNTRPSPWIKITPETIPFIPQSKRLILLLPPDEDGYCESELGQWIRAKREFWYASTESGVLTAKEVTHYMPIPPIPEEK